MNLSKYLFWDVEIESLSFEKDSEFIIPRVLQKGKLKDYIQIKKVYGLDTLKNVLTKTRSLDEKTLAFCCVIFNLQKKDFRCYTLKPFIQKPLNF